MQILKVLWKLLIILGFVFDKYGRIRAEIGIGSFIFGLIVCYKRLTSAIIFDKSVHYAVTLYDITLTILYLIVPLHILSNTTLNVTNVTMVLASSLFISIVLFVLLETIHKNELIKLTESNEHHLARDPLHAERLLFSYFDVIVD